MLNGTTPLPSHVGPFDLLVCDNFAFFCSDLASQLGLPYMVANHGFFFGVGTTTASPPRRLGPPTPNGGSRCWLTRCYT